MKEDTKFGYPISMFICLEVTYVHVIATICTYKFCVRFEIIFKYIHKLTHLASTCFNVRLDFFPASQQVIGNPEEVNGRVV